MTSAPIRFFLAPDAVFYGNITKPVPMLSSKKHLIRLIYIY
jgi:hypothetical protein